MAGGKRKKRYFGKKKPKKNYASQEGEEIQRVRLPRGEGEVLGLVTAMLGGTRLMVECKDGKERMCRIPGRLRKGIWVKEGNYVIVKPWEIEGEKKGDIIWRYNPIQVKWLKKKGYI
ncbi:translation initiation factor eIF-1A [Candidatus Micrarchaeota archaeon]|nr:translation initiation factor eIF-1A [Candidatus Micrarchaeota archaeon]